MIYGMAVQCFFQIVTDRGISWESALEMLQDQLKSGEKRENKFAGFYRDNSSFTLHGSDILLAVKQKDSTAWSGRPYLEYRPNTGQMDMILIFWVSTCDFFFQGRAQNSTLSVS
jgi:hypothetical protein